MQSSLLIMIYIEFKFLLQYKVKPLHPFLSAWHINNRWLCLTLIHSMAVELSQATACSSPAQTLSTPGD